MGLFDTSEQSWIGQTDFSGGVNHFQPGPSQLRHAENIILRGGKPRTRPGIRRRLAMDEGGLAGFWFNEDNAKYNDATHTGFWFPFDFTRSAWDTLQGCELIQFSFWTERKIIFCASGSIYIYEDGYLTEVATEYSIESTEEVSFCQANDMIFIFRGEAADKYPMQWDGSDDGFVAVPPPDSADTIPNATRAIYHANRLWVAVGDDVLCSYTLDFNDWDLTYHNFGIARRGGEEGVFLYAFNEDTILCYKKDATYALRGINSVIESGKHLSDYVTLDTVDLKTGAMGPHAMTSVGEDVWSFGRTGIYSLSRNPQAQLMSDKIPKSAPIQTYIDRVNWNAADGICAETFENYILFSVPLDGATENNVTLVYDLVASAVQGAWVGEWTSAALKPIRYWRDGNDLIYLGNDQRVHQMFCDDACDSQTPLIDTPIYDIETLYEPGRMVRYESSGTRLFKSLVTTIGNAPTNTTYWEEITDPEHAYDITSIIETPLYALSDGKTSMKTARAEIIFKHQHPRISVETFEDSPGGEKLIFDEKEYDYLKYERMNLANWLYLNTFLDFMNPGREDYTAWITSGGIYIGEEGLYFELWQGHTLRWQHISAESFCVGVRMTNSTGKIEVDEIKIAQSANRFASREKG